MKLLFEQKERPNRYLYHGSATKFDTPDLSISNNQIFYLSKIIDYAIFFAKQKSLDKNGFVHTYKYTKVLNIFNAKNENDWMYISKKIRFNSDIESKYLKNDEPHTEEYILKNRDWLTILGEERKNFIIDSIRNEYDGFFNYEGLSRSKQYPSIAVFDINNLKKISVLSVEDLKNSIGYDEQSILFEFANDYLSYGYNGIIRLFEKDIQNEIQQHSRLITNFKKRKGL